MSMRGFTLLETLMYIALFGMLMSGAVATASAVGESAGSVSVLARWIDEENFLMQRLRYMIENSTEITEPQFGDNTEAIVIGFGSSTIKYFAEDGVLFEEYNGIRERLTGVGIEVYDFSCAQGPYGMAVAVTCSFTVSNRGIYGRSTNTTTTYEFFPLNL